MKFGSEVKKSKLNLYWEDVNADYYQIFVKKMGVFYECANVKGSNYATLSMLPVGDGECYIQAIKNGVVIDITPSIFYKIEIPDGICFKSSKDRVSILSSEQQGAEGYRLYKSIANRAFNGVYNTVKNGITIEYEPDAKYKLKSYNIANGERNILSSTSVLSYSDNVFEYATLYKSYEDKMFLSWIYNGCADGFSVYSINSEYPIFETNDGKLHYTYVQNYKDNTAFVIKAFINTPNGKVTVAESVPVALQERKYSRPTVSLIIPAYNAQNYIARSIDSALASNFDDLEIIIVNDGSTDLTQNVINWYKYNYSNIVSIEKENGGVADTRNAGIQAANGDYIAFMDNDDLIRPNMISTLYTSIVKNDCDVAIAPLYRLIDRGYKVHCDLPFDEDIKIDIDKYFEIMYTPGFYNCAIWNKLYRANIVKDHPLGILKYEDVSWTPCILSYTKSFCFIKTPFYEWDRKTRPETFGDVLAKMPEQDLFEHRKQAMLFFVQNGNPEKYEMLKTIAKRRLLRYAKNSTNNAYLELIDKIDKNEL